MNFHIKKQFAIVFFALAITILNLASKLHDHSLVYKRCGTSLESHVEVSGKESTLRTDILSYADQRQISLDPLAKDKNLHRDVTPLKTARESAFNVFGFANVTLLTRRSTPRVELDLLKTPWNVRCYDSAYEGKALWSMVVCIKSNVLNFHRRDLIRKTWGAKKYYRAVRLSVVFLLGLSGTVDHDKKITDEISKHGDLLLVNMTEHYKSVGLKVLAGMQWVKENCQEHWVYASADDDMIPKLNDMYREIQNEIAENNFENAPIICLNSQRKGRRPIRNANRKNHVPPNIYEKDSYPSFCAGGFYSMPVAAANAIFEVSRHHNYFYNDDVWFTGFLRLSAVDAGLLPCRNITYEQCALSKYGGGHVAHAFGKDDKLLKALKELYP